MAKNPSTGTAQQRLFLVLKVVLHAVVVISEVLRLSTKSRCSRCCKAHLYSQGSNTGPNGTNVTPMPASARGHPKPTTGFATVGTSTRMRRAPRQHVLAVGETAPAFPATMPLNNCLITNHGSLLRPLAAIDESPNVERATLLRVLKTAASHSLIENSLQTT